MKSSTNRRLVLPLACTALVTSACGDAPAAREIVESPPLGLVSDPRWLTFTCVEPGCRDQLTARIQVQGDRDMVVKRIVLSEATRTDFTFVSTATTPFILTPTQTFDVRVTFVPTGDPRLGDVDLLIAYADASQVEDDVDRISADELVVPLVRRVIGEPRLTIDPPELFFGAVPLGTQRTLPLTLRNEGFGNLGIVIESLAADFPDEVRFENQPSHAILPGAAWDVNVTYEPVIGRFVEGFITIKAFGAFELPMLVPFAATSIRRPKLELSPASGIDFGELPVGGRAEATLTISNGGAEDLDIRSVHVDPVPRMATVNMLGPGVLEPASISALRSIDVSLSLEAIMRGPVRSDVVFETNDPEAPSARVPIQALIAQPQIRVKPSRVNFGSVPQGWTVVRSLQITNVGYGDLVVSSIRNVLGSSNLFAIRGLPDLPLTLQHNQQAGLQVEFRAEASASFAGTLAIDSNDAATPVVEVAMAAEGASCEVGCPVANATASCTGGVCAIGVCDENWYDVDGRSANGCECAEIDQDPGAFCVDSKYLGRLVDDGDRTTFQGIVPDDQDRDVLRFFAYDGAEFFDDDFDVRISLESADPSIRLCVYRHETDEHLNECFFQNESCPPNRQYRRDGAFGRDDSSDYIIRVFRDHSAAPTCTPYTLLIRNG